MKQLTEYSHPIMKAWANPRTGKLFHWPGTIPHHIQYAVEHAKEMGISQDWIEKFKASGALSWHRPSLESLFNDGWVRIMSDGPKLVIHGKTENMLKVGKMLRRIADHSDFDSVLFDDGFNGISAISIDSDIKIILFFGGRLKRL